MIYVVFVEPETPGNIGFLARTMKNFGLKQMVLINPCPLEHDSYYMAMHAREIIYNRQEYPSLEEFLKTEEIDFAVGTTGEAGGSYNIPRIAVTPDNLAQSLNVKGNIALILGREGDGLTNHELELCDVVVSIPTHESYPILNVTHAAAIIFYELFKNERTYPVEDLDEASLDEKQDLIKYMDDVLGNLDYPPHKKKNASTVFRRVLGRAFISGREAHTLKGMFRRIKERVK
ncbi:TrmJ/YjtD family RNA methyltransferase [Methanobacterium sp.]|uniref:TrmJ/YjtD family RNA methyltransferase n=1 Tax=Methanobacterium sp. TaxID=2164 RepID=UPI0025DE7712|nr:TrmJ/YjtD family RNA methyltransferase [Methanobacterium sp.]MBI5458229.1 TrmJ/YjtD family RNA methyltransferase [Methanobacterium sp.]